MRVLSGPIAPRRPGPSSRGRRPPRRGRCPRPQQRPRPAGSGPRRRPGQAGGSPKSTPVPARRPPQSGGQHPVVSGRDDRLGVDLQVVLAQCRSEQNAGGGLRCGRGEQQGNGARLRASSHDRPQQPVHFRLHQAAVRLPAHRGVGDAGVCGQRAERGSGSPQSPVELEEAGLAERVPDRQDGRRRILQLTDRGDEIWSEVCTAIVAASPLRRLPAKVRDEFTAARTQGTG